MINTKNFHIDINGSWNGDTDSKHHHDNRLCEYLISIFREKQVKNVLDLGCGSGLYAKKFIDNNIACSCYDGHPDTKQITNGICETIDLSQEISLGNTYDCVMSLEVGEHIPKIYENNFINNIVKHSHNFIIISWAIPGQPGDGHINCQNNKYIIDNIQEKNWHFNQSITNSLRRESSLWWFKNTLMFFQKTKLS